MRTVTLLTLAMLLLVLPCAAQTPRVITATIAAGGSLSDAVNFQGCTPARMSISTMASSAVLTFQASMGGTVFRERVDFYNSPVTFPATTGNLSVDFEPSQWFAMQWLKVRSGTAASAVTQATAVTISFACEARKP